ncbi:MAG: hypothetical protein Q9195_001528 [Heterodermia aff. obscurata]
MENISVEASKHIAKDLLSKAHPPDVASTIFTEKVVHKSLFLRPTSPDPKSQDARAQRRVQRLRKEERRKRRQKPKPLSAREKRMNNIYEIPKEQQKYAIYVPLHNMWVQYMWEVLGIEEDRKPFVTAQGAGSKLVSADYHGAELTVVRSRCAGMVGLKGIVVKDTKFTFQIITARNQLRTIPKKHTVFRFEIPQPSQPSNDKVGTVSEKQNSDNTQLSALQFELYGSQFEHRATDRATKKFKQRYMPDL